MNDEKDRQDELLEAIRGNAELVGEIAALTGEEIERLEEMARGERRGGKLADFPLGAGLRSMLEDYAARKGISSVEALRRVARGVWKTEERG